MLIFTHGNYQIHSSWCVVSGTMAVFAFFLVSLRPKGHKYLKYVNIDNTKSFLIGAVLVQISSLTVFWGAKGRILTRMKEKG